MKLMRNPSLKCGTLSIDREHMYPRGYIINQLFTDKYDIACDPKALMNYYFETFGKYHLVTSSENSIVRNFQKPEDFVSPKHSYKSAGITLEKIPTDKSIFGITLKNCKWWRCRNIELFNKTRTTTKSTTKPKKVVLSTKKQDRQKLVMKVSNYITANLTVKEITALTGSSPGTINRIKKELKNSLVLS